eukprot:2037807-Rhodomonas_salina.6
MAISYLGPRRYCVTYRPLTICAAMSPGLVADGMDRCATPTIVLVVVQIENCRCWSSSTHDWRAVSPAFLVRNVHAVTKRL